MNGLQANLLRIYMYIIWASKRENLSSGDCEKQRCRPARASMKTDQRLCYSLVQKYHTISFFKLVSKAEETGLRVILCETLKTCFVVSLPILYNSLHLLS